jgi:hypothetical protein
MEKQVMPRKPIITKKREEVVILVVPTKIAKHVAKITVQSVKLTRVPLHVDALFVLKLNTIHYIVLERLKSKTCHILRQILLL